MGKHIQTHLHRAVEIASDDIILMAMQKTNHFVIDDALIKMMSREDVSESMVAMVQAGIARLPYPELLVEFAVNEQSRAFVMLKEIDNGWSADIAQISHGSAVKVTEKPCKVTLVGEQLVVWESSDQQDGRLAIFSIAVAMVVINMRAISRDRIVCGSLNEKRIRTGKSVIPTHTLLRIGTVTLSDGREVPFGSPEHRHMKLHMRRGHARNQAFGKDLSERKLIYIPPSFVGIGRFEDISQVKRILTK